MKFEGIQKLLKNIVPKTILIHKVAHSVNVEFLKVKTELRLIIEPSALYWKTGISPTNFKPLMPSQPKQIQRPFYEAIPNK